MLKSVTVFCGSSLGIDPLYGEQAFQLGVHLASQDITLIYGGAQVGLMGKVADGCLENGGKVVGIIPAFLYTKEIVHDKLTELIVVDTMHQRKTKMNELCDGVIALPGGFGTLEELFEMLTWGQLGVHNKPIALLNTAGYYDKLISFMSEMVTAGLLKSENEKMVIQSDNIEKLVSQMQDYSAPRVTKWIK